MGQTTFSGPVRSERGFTAVGSNAVVNITAETTLTYADHVDALLKSMMQTVQLLFQLSLLPLSVQSTHSLLVRMQLIWTSKQTEQINLLVRFL